MKLSLILLYELDKGVKCKICFLNSFDSSVHSYFNNTYYLENYCLLSKVISTIANLIYIVKCIQRISIESLYCKIMH